MANRRWLYGPTLDLLLGCGALYAVFALAFAVDGGSLFYAMPPLAPAVLIALVSAPHYGATLLRVYDRRSDRRAYFLFSVVLTAALLALFGLALFDRTTGSVLVTIYLTWSAWHYTAQNYGIASLFLRRREVDVTPAARRVLHASFVLAYAVVFLVLHAAGEPGADTDVAVGFVSLSIPTTVNELLVPAVFGLWAASTLAALAILGRAAQEIRNLAPTVVIIATQALWLTLPFAAHHFHWFEGIVPFGWSTRAAIFTWVAAAHAIQYLWITSFFARANAGWPGQTTYYLRALGAGSALWILPALLFAPKAGSFDWNFGLLLAATINIHHFILDGAIWKLRQSKVARILIRGEAGEDAPPAVRGRLRPLLWTLAVLAVALEAHNLVERFVVLPNALRAQNLYAAADSLDRQAWIGASTAFQHLVVARRMEATGLHEAAIQQYERSAGIEPHEASLVPLVLAYERVGDAGGFASACTRLAEVRGVDRLDDALAATPRSASPTITDRVACGALVERAIEDSRHRRTPRRADPTRGAGQDGRAGTATGYN